MRTWVTWIIRMRLAVVVAVLCITGLLVSQVGKLRVEIDPNRFLPQSHPFVSTSNRVEDIFGLRSVLVIGITPKDGDIYSPEVLGKVERITHKLREDPGVLKNTILSFAAKRAKSITGTPDGMEIRPLMEKVPTSREEIERLRKQVEDNPAYLDAVVSKDGKSVAVIADFRDDPKGFRAMMDRVTPILDAERDGSVRIATGGLPVFLSQLETFSERMGIFMPVAITLVGLVLWLSFRTAQGMVLPIITGLLAVLWSLGLMSLFHVPLDVFNATTPILILTVAAGHAVQMLKRYQEEFDALAVSIDDPRAANRQAVIDALVRIGPVMLTAAGIAALSFLSLMFFEISSIRTFGIFAACGILGALVLEMTLIPALRSWMKPLRIKSADKAIGPVPRLMGRLADLALHRRPLMLGTVAALCVVALVGAMRLRVDDAFRNQFAANVPAMVDDAHLNQQFGGTNALYVMVEADKPGQIQDPAVLKAMDGMQRLMERDPTVGKTLSIVDFIKRMNRAMHADDAAYFAVPGQADLVAQYLFLYANGGDPGDFDTYVDYDYRRANIWGFLREHNTQKLLALISNLDEYAHANLPPGVHVSYGGSVPQGTAIHEIIVRTKALNMAQLAAVVFLLSALAFRSVVAGLFVLAPLAATVLFNFGLMGWTGIPMDIANSITSAMAVGIGADYVIYFLYRLREQLGRGEPLEIALKATLQSAGTAIFFVAAAVAAGYSVLLFSSGFLTHIWMGILISSAMIVSALASLTIVPAFVAWARPKFLVGGEVGRIPGGAAPLAIVLALGIACAVDDARAQELTAADIMNRNYLVDKVATSRSAVTMTLRNKQGQERVRESSNLTRLQPGTTDNQRLVRFVAPAEVKGTSILLVEHARAEDDMWIYLPALKKVRRLVASNKKDSFAGTDFSYGDVIGHAPWDWTHKIVGEESVGGEDCYIVESIPTTPAVRDLSGYSRRKTSVSKTRFVTRKFEAWDAEGQLLKTAEFRQFQPGDKPGKWVPLAIRAKNAQTEHETTIVFRDYRFDADASADKFNPAVLEAGN